MEWLGGGSWIRHMREFENNAGTPIRPGQDSPSNTLATDEDDTLNDDATKIRSDQESPSITLVLESNEEDKVNDDATEITSSLERHRNTSVLEATEAETQNHETIYGKELPLPHESEDMMDDVATPIIDPQEIPRDPGLHSDLVEDVDCEFGRVVDLVKRGYRLKRQDWLNRSVDIAVAEAEVDENNSVPGIDATDQEKIEFLNNKVVSLEERVKYLEGLLNIRGETVKRKKNGVRPPREVGHQDEDDVEVEVNEEQPQEEEEQQQEDDTEDDVDDGDKESENPETNEGQTQEEEEQHQEDDAEVNEEQPQEEEEQQEEEDTEDDVDDGDKESENPETNEEQKQEEEEQQQEDDTEVNTDVDVGAKENGSENP
ncbi:unnamed protein product [Brassica napus]|uniref:(rape) hypothetical protein n=1 Tax=Brassica napus TaxID=3708 RepID=A0A817B1P5_BRANA|nr:unnamed protein product [Brassica napus]